MSVVLLSFTSKDNLSTYITALKNSKTSTGFFELAEKIESIKPINSQDWHPNYYAAYSYVLSAFTEKEQDKLDEILDLAQGHVERAQLISPNNDEILSLAAMIYSARIIVNPNERGYKFGQKSTQMLERARLINQDNPRVLLLIAQSKMYMPVNYGGGCENARPIIEEAITKFNVFEKSEKNSPDWGENDALELLKNCS